MPRYYSPQLGRYVECEIVWNGGQSLDRFTNGSMPVPRWQQYQQSDGVELISQKEIQNAASVIPADTGWRNYPER